MKGSWTPCCSRTFLHNPPGGEQGVVQRQRRVLGVQAVSRPQPGHRGLDGDVCKAERSRGKYISNTGVHVRVITLIGGHEAGESTLPQDPREIVVPCQDLEESGSSGLSGLSG